MLFFVVVAHNEKKLSKTDTLIVSTTLPLTICLFLLVSHVAFQQIPTFVFFTSHLENLSGKSYEHLEIWQGSLMKLLDIIYKEN